MDARKRPLVVVDAGHGGSDPGAVNSRLGLRESDINAELAVAFAALAPPAGFDVILARKNDDYVSLEGRVEISNQARADVFLSFHCNAASSAAANGFEIWTSRGQTKADLIATAIYDELLKVRKVGRADYDDGDPDKETNFYVLRNTSAPAVLIEFGFITSDTEARWMNEPANQLRLVEAVIEGLREGLTP